MFNLKSLLWIAVGLAVALPAFADSPKFLVDSNGMTVYVYDEDQPGVSNCYKGCAKAWPAVPAPATAPQSPFSEIARTDGTKQLAYENHPLYTYVGDSAPGDTTGDGLGGVWHIVPVNSAE